MQKAANLLWGEETDEENYLKVMKVVWISRRNTIRMERRRQRR